MLATYRECSIECKYTVNSRQRYGLIKTLYALVHAVRTPAATLLNIGFVTSTRAPHQSEYTLEQRGKETQDTNW